MSSWALDRIVRRSVSPASGKACEVCEKRPAAGACRLCGRLSCSECLDSETGLCAVCRETLCEECHSQVAVDSCAICGKRVCRSCVVELDYARRICKSCSREFPEPRRVIEERIRATTEALRISWKRLGY